MKSIQFTCLVLMFAGCGIGEKNKKNELSFDNNDKPNILLILSDDVGYGDLSMHGAKDIETPNLDDLASAGITFTNGYVTSSICGPSRASLLTGRYQQRFGVVKNHMPVPITEKLLPAYLKPLGYKTALYGKWHLSGRKKAYDSLINQGYHPIDRGFDEFFGFYGWGTDYFRSKHLKQGKKSVQPKDYLTLELADKSCEFFKKNKEEPFFLYLAFNATHTPMQISEEYLSKFAHINDTTRRVYLGMLKALDDAVGKVLNGLDEYGLTENTLVIFLNDNGGKVTTGSSNLPLRGRKYGVYEGGIKVPFFIRWPSKIKENQTYHKLVSSMDILPTILSAAGVDYEDKDGVNLLPFVNGLSEKSPNEELYWKSEFSQFGNELDRKQVPKKDWSSVRNQMFKLHKFLNDSSGEYEYELYDLVDDEGESKNVANKNKDIVEELLLKLNNWEDEMNFQKHLKMNE